MKILIFGAGRMGLSHAAMAGLLNNDAEIIFIDPSRVVRLMFSLLLGANIRVTGALGPADAADATHAVIATPPAIHYINIKLLEAIGFKGKILIEKPVMISDLARFDRSYIMSGYVLRHSYIWGVVNDWLAGQEAVSVNIRLETNQNFNDSGSGWRSENKVPGLSILYEFGSHCINLLLGLADVERLDLISNSNNYINLASGHNRAFSIELIGNSQRVRKSVYTVEIKTSSTKILTDFYVLSRYSIEGERLDCKSLAEQGISVPAYLRGHEFSLQMFKFLYDNEFSTKDIDDATATDIHLLDIMEKMQCPN